MGVGYRLSSGTDRWIVATLDTIQGEIMQGRKNIKISIVEDSVVTLKLIEQTLKKDGYLDIAMYRSGVAYSHSDRVPDLLITDLHLGEPENGFVLSKRLRQDHPESYAICITSDDNPLLQLEAMGSKVQKLLRKQDNHLMKNVVKSVDLFAQAISGRKKLKEIYS